MPDDAGERTEAPTPRRRTEARNRGQVAKSQDLSGAVLLLAGLLGLSLFGPRIWLSLLQVMHAAFEMRGAPRTDESLVLASRSAVSVGGAVAPVLLLLVVAAAGVMLAQVGLLFTTETIKPSLEKMSPLGGIKRIFSAQSLVQLCQNMLKLSLVVAVAYLAIEQVVHQILLAHTLDYRSVFAMGAQLVFWLGLKLAIVLLLLAVIDFVYQMYRHEKQLKMTKDEVKEETKRMDGDPVIKRRRREAQLKLAVDRVQAAVPKADVVVTNPTHYAVALQYDAKTMAAPKVLAKGVDYLAQRMRELAAAAGVPIVERPDLARMLYAEVDSGQEIPQRFYQAVAEVLAYVYELSGRRMGPTPVPVGG